MISQNHILRSLPIGAALISEDFATSEINRALADLYQGIPAHENEYLNKLFDETAQQSILLQMKSNKEQAVLRMVHLPGTDAWVNITIVPAPQSTSNVKYLAYFEDVSALKHANDFIDTANVNFSALDSHSFYKDVCLYLTKKLGYEYAIIGELTAPHLIQVKGAAAGDTAMDSFEYELKHTPCENVVGRKTCVYKAHVADLFPQDHLLKEMGAESYVGSPLFDSEGNATGLIALIGKEPIIDETLATAIIKALSDRVSAEIQRERATHQLHYQATHDVLCDIYNRYAFEQEIRSLITLDREPDVEHAVFYMDLDQFKIVNDTCGHSAGDELLKQVSLLLGSKFGDDCTLARLGGDEFGLLKINCNLEEARALARSLLEELAEFQFVWDKSVFKANISIGIVAINEHTQSVADVIKQADTACYLAKENGRHRYHVYLPDDVQMNTHENELLWVSELHQSIENDSFILYAQPIVSTPHAGREGLHFELLIRKLDDEGKLIPPNAFLPAAERYNVISKLDEWVVKKCFKYLSENIDFVNNIDFVSVNLSGQSLTSERVLKLIQNELVSTQVPAEKICFEITETTAISKLSEAKEFIDKLKVLGCRFALDDFGSGLSSFGYLKFLPVDYLKIDGLFVKDILSDPVDHVMVKSINDMGHALGMQTIAEFVENDTIKAVLNSIGVDYVQGYGIGKPIPFDDVIASHR